MFGYLYYYFILLIVHSRYFCGAVVLFVLCFGDEFWCCLNLMTVRVHILFKFG